MSHPWLSVIVPTYNGAAYLPAALESVAAQGDRGLEVLAVDDGSTDATLEILRGYQARLPMVIIEREHAGNWVSGVNFGLARAQGAYVSVLHQDDLWLPCRLQVLRRVVARWPAAAMVAHPCWYLNAAGKRIGYWHCSLPRRARPLSAREVVARLLVQCSIGAPAPLFRADIAARAGPMDEDLWYSADWDYWLRLACMGSTVYHPTPMGAFRIHSLSQTLTRPDLPSEMERQQRIVLARHLWRWETADPEGQCIRRVATFSADVNVQLARFTRGERADWGRLVRALISLGPAGWSRYFRASGIVERGGSRWQAGAVSLRSAHGGARAAARQSTIATTVIQRRQSKSDG